MVKILDRVRRPYDYIDTDFFISSSSFTTQKIFKSAFQLNDNQYKPFAYPRSDIFFWDKHKIEKFIQDFEPFAVQTFIQGIKKFDKVYFYLPTFRDSERDFMQEAGMNLEELNKTMLRTNSVFVFKMHPRTQIDLRNINRYSNLKVLQKEADIYTIMPFTDCLISDYSSVYFDYLLLQKQIILFPFDFEKYLEDSRALYFDYQEVMKGEIAHSFSELLNILKKESNTLNEGLRREQRHLRQLFWDDYQGQSAAKIIDFLQNEY